MENSRVSTAARFFSLMRGRVSTRWLNWLPPTASATRWVGSSLAAKKPCSAAVSSASLVMMPLIRQPSGSSVWQAAVILAPFAVGEPTAAYTVLLQR